MVKIYLLDMKPDEVKDLKRCDIRNLTMVIVQISKNSIIYLEVGTKTKRLDILFLKNNLRIGECKRRGILFEY